MTFTTSSTVRLGSMISEFAVPGIIPVSKRAGLDFSILDAEHGAFDLGTIAMLAAVAKGHGYELYVRVPAVDKSVIGPILDAGAAGIVAPMIESAQQAAELVRLSRYTPIGERGISLTRAHSGYQVSDVAAYLAVANSQVKVYAQIESRSALENLTEIAAVPGLSGLILGPNDLLASLGTPGDYGNPELSRAIRSIAAVCARANLASGVITGRIPLLVEAIHAGMNIASIDSDLGYFIAGATRAVEELARALEKDS